MKILSFFPELVGIDTKKWILSSFYQFIRADVRHVLDITQSPRIMKILLYHYLIKDVPLYRQKDWENKITEEKKVTQEEELNENVGDI